MAAFADFIPLTIYNGWVQGNKEAYLSISEMRTKFQFLDGDMKIIDIPTLLW